MEWFINIQFEADNATAQEFLSEVADEMYNSDKVDVSTVTLYEMEDSENGEDSPE